MMNKQKRLIQQSRKKKLFRRQAERDFELTWVELLFKEIAKRLEIKKQLLNSQGE